MVITFFKTRKNGNWMTWARRIGGIAAIAGGAMAVMRMLRKRNEKSGMHEMSYEDEQMPTLT